MITKEKYQNLMDEKIRIEREKNRLFDIAKKLLQLTQEAGIEVNLSEFRGIKSQAGVPLIPGDGEQLTNLSDYGDFNNKF